MMPTPCSLHLGVLYLCHALYDNSQYQGIQMLNKITGLLNISLKFPRW